MPVSILLTKDRMANGEPSLIYQYLPFSIALLFIMAGLMVFGVFQFKCPSCRCFLFFRVYNPLFNAPKTCPKCDVNLR